MKSDRVAIGIVSNEEATEGTVGERAEDCAAPLDNQVVQRIGVSARDPETPSGAASGSARRGSRSASGCVSLTFRIGEATVRSRSLPRLGGQMVKERFSVERLDVF